MWFPIAWPIVNVAAREIETQHTSSNMRFIVNLPDLVTAGLMIDFCGPPVFNSAGGPRVMYVT